MGVQDKLVVAAQYEAAMAGSGLLDVRGQSAETAADMQRRSVQARRAVIV